MNKKLNGKRLRLAREYRGLLEAELAMAAGVSQSSIFNMENGREKGSLEVTMSISKALNFPIAYFYEPDETDQSLYMWAPIKSKQNEERRFTATAVMVSKLYEVLGKCIDFKDENIPIVDDECSPETAAKLVRDFWNLGDEPIDDIIYLMENNGILVTERESKEKSFDGINIEVVLDGRHQHVVVLNKNRSIAVRRVFDCAHILGHIVMNHTNRILCGEELNTARFLNENDFEEEANRFAAAFLLPEKAFVKDLVDPYSLESYVKIKQKWGASIRMMMVRALKLNLLDSTSYHGLMKQVERKGWHRREPLDDEILFYRPGMFKRVIEMLLNEGQMTLNEILNFFKSGGFTLYPSEYEKLLKIAEGSFRRCKQTAEVIPINSFKDTKVTKKTIKHLN